MPTALEPLGLFLLSAATLLLQVAWTRCLSVSLWYHFAFLVVSTALLGFGAAGVLLATSRRLRALDAPRLAAWGAAGSGVAGLGAFALVARWPADPFAMLASPVTALLVGLEMAALVVPFLGAGLAVGALLSRRDAVARLYAADLAGAGVGAAAAAALIPLVGGPGAVVAASALALLSAALLGGEALGRRARAALWAAGALGIAAAPLAESAFPLRTIPGKQRVLGGADVVSTAWNAFSRVDHVTSARGQRRVDRLLIDGGTAVNEVPDLRGGVERALGMALPRERLGTGVVLERFRAPSVLVIGAGGGQEVFEALYLGASRVVAVEVNPILTRLAVTELADLNGGLFRHPRVELHTAEARAFLRSTPARFDAILLRHTISNAAQAAGGLGLAENYLLTLEALGDLLDHLAPGGAILFTRPEAQLPRLVAMAEAALGARGRDPARHLVAFRSRDAFAAGLVVSESPVDDAERARILGRLGHGAAALAPERPADLDLEPPTDDRPFFNRRLRWSALGPSRLADVLRVGADGRRALEDRPVAEVALILVTVEALLLAALALLLPLRRLPGRVPPAAALYFAAIGLGFALVEVATTQRLTLWLGEPAYTLAVTLATLLVSSGAGSALAARWDGAPGRGVAVAVALVAGALVLHAAVVPALLDATLAAPLWVRLGACVLAIVPLGVGLGMPMPLGLRLVRPHGEAVRAYGLGVNGFCSVLGACAAMFAAMTAGFRATLGLAAALYVLAWLAGRRLR